jgi:Na+/pantothenate symporter
VEEKALKVLKLDEMTNLLWIIFTPLIVIILIFSMIEYGFFFWWEYVMFAGITVVFVVPVICIILGVSIKILNKLNFLQTDGDWGTLDLMKSFYSELYPEYFDDEK